jgi:hypothetical protein
VTKLIEIDDNNITMYFDGPITLAFNMSDHVTKTIRGTCPQFEMEMTQLGIGVTDYNIFDGRTGCLTKYNFITAHLKHNEDVCLVSMSYPHARRQSVPDGVLGWSAAVTA